MLVRTHFRLEDGKLIVVKNPKVVDFEIVTTFRTLARIICNKKRLSDGTLVKYDPMDAFLNNDVVFYGRGVVPRFIHVFKEMFNSEVVRQLRERFSFLEEFI